MTPNRVNRAYWPTKDFFVFVVWSMEKIAWDGAKWGREGFFFQAKPDLADIFGQNGVEF